MNIQQKIEKLNKYWIERNESMFLAGEKKGLELAKRLEKNYRNCQRRIEAELALFYNQYAKESGLEISDVRKLLSKSELKTFKEDLKDFLDYAKKHNFIDSEKTKLKLLQLKSRVSRLEELNTKINFEISKITNESEQELKQYLSDIYEDGYYRTIFNTEKQIGFAISFTELNTKAIEKAISTNYMGGNYSSLLWKNKDNLMNILEQQIPQGIVLGYNPRKLAQLASKKLKTNYNNTVRLIRTEYNLILNDSILQGYTECGITEYQLSATLDNRTSEICQEMDRKIYKVKEAIKGVNYPPFHPNCRTTTVAYFEPDEFDEQFGLGTRLAKGPNGQYYKIPANISYKEWKN